MIALAGCDGEAAKLTIRSMPAPVSSVAKPVPQRVAEARGQLALGNVALALESYRKAVREQPDNIDALTGIAGCYDQMGRFDLSQRNYEAALALAPHDTTVLAAFAASLDLQGRSEEAVGVRGEIKVAMAATFHPTLEQLPLQLAAPALTPASPVGSAKVAARHSVTVALPAPKPALVAAAPAAISVAVAQLAAPVVPIAASRSVPVTLPTPPMVEAQPVPPPAPSRSITTVLPQAKSAAAQPQLPVENAPSAAAQQAVPAPVSAPMPPAEQAPVIAPERPFHSAPIRSVAVEPSPPTGPTMRLERLSLGEVALVNSGRPQWRAQMVQRSERSTTIRFVPLRTASVQTAGVRLLNAARYQGLAANTRSFLAVRGWRKIEIGDAAKVRQTSLILYPPSRRGTAKRLAAQFGFAIASRPEGTDLVMLIGRDATKSRRYAS
ncbi:MAG: tetratricopeptide repeat protein [Sphingomicrobium sp.]